MMQVIEQTRDEKTAMYMKLRKSLLVEMLLNNQELADRLLKEKRDNDVRPRLLLKTMEGE